MSHKKFGPDRFSHFDVYWIQTNRHPDRQTNRQAKFIYRLYFCFSVTRLKMNIACTKHYRRGQNLLLIIFQNKRPNVKSAGWGTMSPQSPARTQVNFRRTLSQKKCFQWYLTLKSRKGLHSLKMRFNVLKLDLTNISDGQVAENWIRGLVKSSVLV